MRVAIFYDCMFPYTVGGAERWYVDLATRLSDDHEVNYLTLRQWDRGTTLDEPFNVVEVGPRLSLYTDSGRRRIAPPLRFGAGVFWHLLRHGRRYDIVHGASFPYFSVIGAWLALRIHRRTKLVVDWHELWTKEYWQAYLGPIGGKIGYAVQAICKRLPDHNFTESKMHEQRLQGLPVTRLTGLFREGDRPDQPAAAADPPHVVFAGRQIPEKNGVVLPAALVAARKLVPSLTATIFGHGPEHEQIRGEIDRLDAGDFIALPGFVDSADLTLAMGSASCMVLPSLREGYGMVVLEAASVGTPSVVVAGDDNAATELIAEGENGYVAASAEPTVLGAAIARAAQAGTPLRQSTWRWYEANREALSIEDSLATIANVYESLVKR